MNCPLSIVSRYYDGKETQIIYGDCLKEECAWWIPQTECCSIHILADMLGHIVVDLKEIKDKMPHEGQFRK